MAENDKTKENEVVEIPVAKRHKLLQDIDTQIGGMEISDTFRVADHTYHMSTLTSDEEVWADAYCNMSSEISAFSSMRTPRLAASIKAIDGVSVDELFTFPDDMAEADRKYHSGSQYRKRYWTMNQMMLWLGDRSSKLTKELWSNYSKLVERRDASWDELKKSSAGTPGGKSKATSSQEKESSPATQTSPA